jgi:hypothetical protein
MALRSRVLLLALSAGLVLTAERAHCEPASLARRIATGCEAVNAGAFILDCNVAPSGLIAGPKGSGLVRGFAPEHLIHARNYWFKTRPIFSVLTTGRHWSVFTPNNGLGAAAYRLSGLGHISSIENTLPVSVRAS